MMTVQQIFDLGIKFGIAADPRGAKGVENYMQRRKKMLEELPAKEQTYVDATLSNNPYPDSAIHVDDGKTKVRRVLAGIDITPSDILLASQLTERGRQIDLAIAHHPVGRSLANLHEVMAMAVDIYESFGVPVHLAEKIMEERVKEVSRSVHGLNHYGVVNTAELLGINCINVHTITDNLVQEFIDELMAKKKPDTVGDLMDSLLEIPEYRQAKRMGAGPKIYAGSPHHRVGRYLVEMTGGTEPSPKIYEQFSRSGISTIIGMHMREQSLEKGTGEQLNIIMAGHISSDSLGMNLFLDELEKRGIEIVPCGGLIRVSRNKKRK